MGKTSFEHVTTISAEPVRCRDARYGLSSTEPTGLHDLDRDTVTDAYARGKFHILGAKYAFVSQQRHIDCPRRVAIIPK